MAFGLTPKYIEQISLDGLTTQQFLALGLETAGRLGWNVYYKSNTGFIAYTAKGMFRSVAKVTITIEAGLVNLRSESTGSELFDMGRNKKTILSFTEELESLRPILSSQALDGKYAEIQPGLPAPEEDYLNRPPLSKSEQFAAIFSIFIPRNGYFVTPVIIDLNIIVFILMAISGAGILDPGTKNLVAWGANYTVLTLDGQWWRLITNCFVHIGIVHLLLNMYALLFIGILLEPMLGKLKFATAYLFTGIMGSLASLYWHDITVSAGASGAIFGMYGVFLAMLTTNFIERTQRKQLLASIGIFVVYNLANGMKGHIDNAAHIGGLVSGIVLGYAFYPVLSKPKATKLNYGILVLVIVLFTTTSFVFYKKIPNDIVQYEAKMKSFSAHEEAALEFYKLPANATKETRLATLKDNGIPNWKADITILNEVNHLHIPANFKEQAATLLDYCNDRLATYILFYKAVDENSPDYDDSIRYYNSRIEQILNSMNHPKDQK